MTTFAILPSSAVPTCPQERPASHRDCSADYAEIGATMRQGPSGLRLLEVPDEYARQAAALLEVDHDCYSYVRIGLDVADIRAAERYLLGDRRAR